VRTEGDDSLARFRAWCEGRAFKCVRIVLARGEHVEQPMATWRRGPTTLPLVLDEARHVAASMDWPVVRVKVEASPDNDEVPRDNTDMGGHDAANYFEHHVKLRRETSATRDALLRVCQVHGAHLSRNSFHEDHSGWEVRFVTLRSYGVGRGASERQVQRLLADLAALGEDVLETESEYCVHDSNLDLDRGWLTTAG
jgi:hypothetical protein